jgi:hypothetical protein
MMVGATPDAATAKHSKHGDYYVKSQQIRDAQAFAADDAPACGACVTTAERSR